MLRLLASCALLVALVPPLAAQRPADSDSALVAQVYADLLRGDVQAVQALLDEHVVWEEGEASPVAGRYVGRGTVAERVLRPLLAGGVTDVPDALSVEGGRVVVLGTRRRLDSGLGRSAATPFRHVWRLLDGRVVGVERSINPTSTASDSP